jgi:hypothetical protein
MGGSLMIASAISTATKLWPDRRAALRMLAAGTAWGVVMAAGFAGFALWNCGTVCPEDVALTTVTSIAAGILTIGPLAAFGHRP